MSRKTPIKDIYLKYINQGPKKVIEEWAKYKTQQWLDNNEINKDIKEFLDDRFAVNPKINEAMGEERYLLYKKLYGYISNIKRKYIYGKKERSMKRGYSKLLEVPLVKCAICNNKSNLERHHIIPFDFGGNESEDNIIVLCKKCHTPITKLFLGHKWAYGPFNLKKNKLESDRKYVIEMYKTILNKEVEFIGLKEEPSERARKIYKNRTNKILDDLRVEVIEFLQQRRKD